MLKQIGHFASHHTRACPHGNDAAATVTHVPACAGAVLADGMLPGQTAGSLRTTFAAKAAGAANLAAALAATGQGILLGFSSIAALLGNPGQLGYSAANGALDTWASDLQSQARPLHDMRV